MEGDAETDAELLRLLRDGEDAAARRRAFDTLYKRYAFHSVALAHSHNPAEKEDIAQEVWMQIWRKPPDTHVGFRQWLTVAIRRTAARRSKERSKTATLEGEPAGQATSQTRQLARREAVDVVKQAHRDGRITTKEYEAIVDSVSDDTTSEEIATARGLSRTGWWDRRRRCLEKIRRIVGW